ncbi:MAG: MBL fold metallo-hydrolase [Nevskiales bacterium]
MKKAFVVVLSIGILLALAVTLFGERLLVRAMKAQVQANISGNVLNELPDGLHLFLCGAGAPLPDPTRAGPCIMVLAGNALYVVDIGSGAARNFGPMGIPSGRVDALLLTHFHSDHIDGIGELMTTRWAAGAKKEPMPIYGPPGVGQIVAGFNQAYSQDFEYRIAHHGKTVTDPRGAGAVALPFALPAMGQAVEVLSRNGLQITAFAVEHEPVEPAVGYRFDYKGRSLVISGDTKASENLRDFSKAVDLLAHEALSPDVVGIMGDAAEAEGATHIHKITVDILDYHTTPVEAAQIAQQAQVKHLLLYHLVPPLPVKPLEFLFMRGVDDAFDGPTTLGRDGMLFSLPAGSDEIRFEELL